MALSLDDVARIAHLARLEIEPRDAVSTLDYLNGVFTLIEQMQAVDTVGIEPMTHAQEFALRLREDRVTEGDQRATFQDLAPQAEAGLYLVPRVIE